MLGKRGVGLTALGKHVVVAADDVDVGVEQRGDGDENESGCQ